MKITCTCPHQDANEPHDNHDPKCPVRTNQDFEAAVVDAAMILLAREPNEELNAQQLDQLAYDISYAMMKLRRVPGGREAIKRHYEDVLEEARRRGLRI